jgi:hypothetical protein
MDRIRDFNKGIQAMAEANQLAKTRAAKAASNEPSMKDIAAMLAISIDSLRRGQQAPDPSMVAGAGTVAQPQYDPNAQIQAPAMGGGYQSSVSQYANDPIMGSAYAATIGAKPSAVDQAQFDIAAKTDEQRSLIPGKVAEKEQIASADLRNDALKTEITSDYNLSLVAGAMLPLTQTLVDAYKEGGAGNKFKSIITDLADQGWLGEKAAEKKTASTAYDGKTTEVLLKMMPIMSSQYGKEGSTRILQGVFDRLGRTLPDLGTAPKNAREKLSNTLDTLYGVTRAVSLIDLSKFDVNNEKDINRLADKIATIAREVDITGTEKEAYDGLKNTVLAPLDDFITNRDLVDTSDIDKQISEIDARLAELGG